MLDYYSSIKETDKFRKPHNYQMIYPNLLWTKPKKILEIGTASCGFAKFLKDNNIGEWLVGVDIKKGIISNHIPSKKTWEHLFDDFFEGNAMSPEFIDWIEKKKYWQTFDLVIDDASHQLDLQIYLIQMADRLLSDNGVYITEDIGSYQQAKSIIQNVPKSLKDKAYIVDLTDSVNDPFDRCVIIDNRKL